MINDQLYFYLYIDFIHRYRRPGMGVAVRVFNVAVALLSSSNLLFALLNLARADVFEGELRLIVACSVHSKYYLHIEGRDPSSQGEMLLLRTSSGRSPFEEGCVASAKFYDSNKNIFFITCQQHKYMIYNLLIIKKSDMTAADI
jgi:hypothetical protein